MLTRSSDPFSSAYTLTVTTPRGPVTANPYRRTLNTEVPIWTRSAVELVRRRMAWTPAPMNTGNSCWSGTCDSRRVIASYEPKKIPGRITLSAGTVSVCSTGCPRSIPLVTAVSPENDVERSVSPLLTTASSPYEIGCQSG